jgi:hypothetical protein
VDVPDAGLLTVSITWAAGPRRLTLFADGKLFTSGTNTLTVALSIASATQVIVHVGLVSEPFGSGHAPFTVATTFQ